jgi:hypothetical protein
LAEVLLVQFVHYEIALPSVVNSLKNSQYVQPTYKEWGVMPTPRPFLFAFLNGILSKIYTVQMYPTLTDEKTNKDNLF